MPVGKPVLILLVLLLSACSGCLFFKQTEFHLLSYSIGDDEGFPYFSVTFNTSDTIVLTLTNPQQASVFSDSFYYGEHTESLYLDEFRTTPPSGTYILHVADAKNKTIYTHDLVFHGANLTCAAVVEDWWVEQSQPSLVGLHVRVKNSGDLPSYPSSVTVTRGTTTVTAALRPTAILPQETTDLDCFLSCDDLFSIANNLTISVEDKNQGLLAQTTHVATPVGSLASWDYQWHYQGSRTLSIPGLDWFFTLYANLPRLNITDYAAYVFDSADDSFVTDVATRVLAEMSTVSDVQRINLLASFVQSFRYAPDDPSNETCEYPRYPVETVREQQGDCEDKAILAAALLQSQGYNVSLLRLPNHMAVGVALNHTLPEYQYYIDRYYFLETTALHTPLGYVPKEYQHLQNITTYPLTQRPLLLHQWKSAIRYTLSSGEDYVKLKIVVENKGTAPAEGVSVLAGFYDDRNTSYNTKTVDVPSVAAGMKRIVELVVTIPSSMPTTLRTEVFLDEVMVHQKESATQFP